MKEKKRLLVISITTFFLFAALLVQYFRIQIVEGDEWQKAALSQHEFILLEPAIRGTFYSNTSLKKGHPEKATPLVIDVTKFHLYLDPLAIPSALRKEVALTLFSLLNLTSFDEKKHLIVDLGKKSHNRKIAMWIENEKKESIETWWRAFAKKNKLPSNSLYFVTDYQRSYPFGKLLGQVLHTIRDLKDEKTQEGVPTGGLEAYFNEYLKGKMGKRKLHRSPLNALETDNVIEEPENGADIYLTINHCLQAIAEEEIEKGVKKAKAKGGWAMMMDPETGEILALAQYPFFDPSKYKEFFNDQEKIENAKIKPLTDAFELGSIMKPITAATALKANEDLLSQGKPVICKPAEKIDTSRSIFPGRGNKPLKDTHFYHYLNMYMALQKSSNVYMAQMIDRVVHTLGNAWYRKVLVKTFGFGQKTGLELPGEAMGLVPTPGKLHPNGSLEWSLPTPYSLAMGHNMLATSVQMLCAYAVIANGGKLVKPTLIRQIVKTDKNGKSEILLDNTTEDRKKSFPQVLSKAVCLEVMRGMKYTTKAGGSGHLAELAGYSEAGKTGTSEKIVDGCYSKKRHVSSFIGFAPADIKGEVKTRLCLIVTIDDPEFQIIEGGIHAHRGGYCAAPVFREIATRTLEYLGVDPDDPYGYSPQDPRYNAEKADWIKEVKELKELHDQWNKKK